MPRKRTIFHISLLSTICLLQYSFAFSQQNKCSSLLNDSVILQRYGSPTYQKSLTPTYIIPVVFHIFYDTTIYNQPTLTTADIDSVLLQTNRIINLQTSDTAFVIPNFQPVIGDLSIEFRRASIDTNGNCFSGIVYHDLVNGLANPSTSYQNFSYNPNHYLNVNINQNVNGFSSGAYAYFPATYANPANQYDGIVFKSSVYFDTKTMVHEIGHYVGLLHTFGLANDVYGPCGDDFVSDTPPTSGSPYNCDTTRMVCTPGLIENVQNHMDYSSQECRIMFTDGQVSRAHGILNDTTLSRAYIWRPSNLVATGVDTIHTCNTFEGQIIYQPYGIESCTVPTSFGFTLWNKFEVPDSVLWTTTEGIISDPLSEEIEIQFATDGPKTITLTCYYNGISYLYNKNVTINRTTNNGLSLATTFPYHETFENNFNLPDQNLKVQNNSGLSWQLHAGHGYGSDSCLYIPIETGSGIDTNTVIIGTFDLLNLHHPQLSFKISTSKGSNVIDRKLIVKGRSLCSGDVFLFKFDYDSLFALSNTSSNFYPTSNSEWKTINILLDQQFFGNYSRRDMEFSIQLIKYFQPGHIDENIFIDNININDTIPNASPIANLTVSNYNFCGSAPTLEFSEQCSNIPDSVKWFFNGYPLFGNPQAFYNILPAIPDTSTITLIAYNSFGTDTITKLVIHRQIYAYNINATPSTICQGDTSTLHATFSNAENFTWENITSFNSNLYVITNNDSIILVNPNNTQTFKVTATNSFGCSAATSIQVNVTPLPYVSITSPNCVAAGSTVQLSTPPGPNFDFLWSPSAGLNVTDSNVVTANIDSTISYQVAVTSAGCTFTQTATIHVSNPINNVSLSIGDSVLCSNQGTMIYASNVNGGSLVWGMDPCCVGTYNITNDSAYVDPFFNHTNYFVVVTDSNGCISSDTVHTSLAPNPTFYTYPFEYTGGFSSIRLCVNEDSVTLYTVDNDNLIYQWTTTSGAYFTNTQNNRSTFHIPNPSSTFYPVNVIATNTEGCSVTNTYMVEKYWGSTEPIYSINPASPTICDGQSVSVTLSPGGNYYYYYWVDTQYVSNILPLTYSNFNFNTGNGNTATISPPAPTHYTYIVYDYYTNCAKTRDYFVNVLPSPSILATISDSSICVGDTSLIQLTGATTYVWNPTTNLILTGGNSVGHAFPLTPQTYTVVGTTGTCSSTVSIPISISSNPTVIALANDSTLCIGDSLLLSGSGASTYTWNNGVIDGQLFLPPGSNIYTVIGTDLNGCNGSDNINISVTNLPNVNLGVDTIICDSAGLLLNAGNIGSSYYWFDASTSQQYLFPASAAGSYNVWVEVTNSSGCVNNDSILITVQNCASSINDEDDLIISLFPNPATDIFYINGSEEIELLEIYDLLGRKVNSTPFPTYKIDVNGLASGTYTVILSNNSFTLTKKLIITK